VVLILERLIQIGRPISLLMLTYLWDSQIPTIQHGRLAFARMAVAPGIFILYRDILWISFLH